MDVDQVNMALKEYEFNPQKLTNYAELANNSNAA